MGLIWFSRNAVHSATPYKEEDTKQTSLRENSSIAELMENTRKRGGVDWSDDDPRWEDSPLAHERFPTPVHMKIKIVHLKDINTELGTASLKLDVILNWHDGRLVGRCIKPFGRNVLPPRLWAPHVSIAEALVGMNVTRNDFMQVPFTNVKSVEGDCFTCTVFEGEIQTCMDLHDFPFDTSDVVLSICANRHRLRDGEEGSSMKGDYRLLPQRSSTTAGAPAGSPGGDPLCLPLDLGLPEWQYVACRSDYVNCQKGTFDTYRIAVCLNRSSTYFIDKVLVPLAMIAILNACVFALDIESLSDRLQHSVGLFLTGLALLFVVGSELPKTDYRTAIDKVILSTNTLLLGSCVEAVAVYFVSLSQVDGDDYSARRINAYCAVFYIVYFAVCMVWIFVPLWIQKRRIIKQARSAQVGETATLINAVNSNGRSVLEHRYLYVLPGQLAHAERLTKDITSDIPLWLAHSLFDVNTVPTVLFVKASSDHRLVFEHADGLRAGKVCPMTLTSHPGYAVAFHVPRVMKVMGRYLMVALGVSPITTESVPLVEMRYEDENFLVHVGDKGREGYEDTYPPMVANIDNWLYEEGTGLSFLASPDPVGTRMTGGGRDFVINNDGTISAVKIPGCVLGVAFDPSNVILT